MRRTLCLAVFLSIGSSIAQAQPAQPSAPAPASAAPPAASVPAASAPAPATASSSSKPVDPTRGDKMRAYHDAMEKRRLGSQEGVTEQLTERVAEAEALVSTGRTDEAIARLTEIVEHPRFDLSLIHI